MKPLTEPDETKTSRKTFLMILNYLATRSLPLEERIHYVKLLHIVIKNFSLPFTAKELITFFEVHYRCNRCGFFHAKVDIPSAGLANTVHTYAHKLFLELSTARKLPPSDFIPEVARHLLSPRESHELLDIDK